MCQDSECDAVVDYFRELDDHILSKISNGKVGDSCFAAVMLICAAIDSLGRLTDRRSHVGSKQRFTYVLQRYFPQQYARGSTRLYKLRCDLMHEGLNTATFLAATDYGMGHFRHLKTVTSSHGENICVHTGKFFCDLVSAVKKVRRDLDNDPSARQRAARRLQQASIEMPGPKFATHPSRVWFRQK